MQQATIAAALAITPGMKNITTQQQGVTLLELLIGVSIAAILGLTSLPLLALAAQSHSVKQLKGDTELFVHICKVIRHRAIAERRDFTLSYQQGTCSVTPLQPGLSGLCRYLQPNAPGRIAFSRDGVVTPTTLQFISNSSSTRCMVTLSLRGRIKRQCSTVR